MNFKFIFLFPKLRIPFEHVSAIKGIFITLTITCFVININQVLAQNSPAISILKTDPKITKLRTFRRAVNDSAFTYANYLIEQAKAQNDKHLECEALMELGRIYFAKDDQIKALEIIKNASDISSANDNCYYVAPQFIGFILNRQAKAEEAMKYLFIALKRAEEAKLDGMIISSYFSIADAYRENKKSATAINYVLKGLQLAEAIKDTVEIVNAYSTLGNVLSNREYVNEKRLDSAVIFQQKIMLPPFNNKWKSPYDSTKHFSNMGRLYRMQKKFDLAKYHLDIAIDIAKRRNFKSYQQSVLNEIATLELDKGNSEKALAITKVAKTILPDSQTSLVRVKELEERSQYASSDVGNFKEAYEHLVNAGKIKDSLYNLKKQAGISEIEKKYERDTKVLKANNLILRRENERNIVIALSIFILIIITSYFGWRIYKRSQQNRFLKTLIHEVNHRTKNNLQMLNSLITSIYQNVQDDDAKAEIKKLKSYIKSFGLVYENLNRTASFDDVDIAAYTKDIGKAVISNNGNKALEFVYQSNASILVPTEKAVLIGLIVNELITNSLKHAFDLSNQNQIAISVNGTADRFVQLVYEDNGHGKINTTNGKNSFGMGMIQQLVKQLKGTMLVEPSQLKKITINIPLN